MKKFMYPNSLLIGKAKYKLELLPELAEKKKNHVTRGWCDPGKQLIQLRSKQSERDLFSTFLHELLHAVEAEHNIKLKHKLVYALEGPLADALLRNFLIIPKR